MKIATDLCDDDSIRTIRKILQGHDVGCYSDESFASNAEVLLFLHWDRVRKNLKNMHNLMLVHSLSAGVDHVDISLIPKKAYFCSNAGANAWAVAEHALALILASLKKMVYRDREMRQGGFPQMLESRLLRGKSIAIVGFGNIGKSLARMLEPFSASIYAVNRSGKYSGEIKVEKVIKIENLEEILPHMDVIVLTLPLTPETRGMINRKKLQLMKKDAILVNVSRGKIIVEKDLFSFLEENPGFTAALDVWWRYGKEFRQNYPFETLDNVILSPHCGGVYENWLVDAVEHARENIERLEKGEKLKNVVKEPQE